MQATGEIVLYQAEENVQLEVRLENETVWLTQQQMADLFQTDRTSIVRHINNIYKTAELDQISTCAKIAQVRKEGDRMVNRNIPYYCLDMIISVGYRVNSIRGVRFRQWANQVLKDYMIRGYAVQQKIQQIENKLENHALLLKEHSDKIDFFVKTALPPLEGVFYDGQVFDAHNFVSDLIRSARSRIVLIDNYVDDTVLKLLDKRNCRVKASIYTQRISPAFQTDIDLHNAQYEQIEVRLFPNSHDRFLLIDETVYHIGASLKDLGKKWFAFSKMNITSSELLSKI